MLIYTCINLIMHWKLALPNIMHYENFYCTILMTSVVLENAPWPVPLQPPRRELEDLWGGFPQKIRCNWGLGWWSNMSAAAICIHNLFPLPPAFWWGFKDSSTWHWVYVRNMHQTYTAIQKDCSAWRQVQFLIQSTAELIIELSYLDIKPFFLHQLSEAKQHLCPVTALAEWLAYSKIEWGPLFPKMNKHEQILQNQNQSMSMVCATHFFFYIHG